MTLLRVYAKVDSNHKIALPRGIRKALDIKPGDKLELTLVPNGVFLRRYSFGMPKRYKKNSDIRHGNK